jgi:D-alanyl-D-alanine carboxypeptidase/D-alanyl-D-alanine carboxypeptidase (penicillin-binding protein 5/6)
VAIACYIGNDITGFADMMNDKARSMGLTNTHFVNPHGLDDKEHYTNAKELALIAAEALKNDDFKKIVSTYKKTFATEERSRTYVNHNKLLRLYDGSIGIKTGFTKKSGRCLVGAAEKDGLKFVTVTLDAPNDWNDHATLFDYGYESLEKITLIKAFDHVYKIPVIDGESKNITVANTDLAEVITKRGDNVVCEQIKLVRYAIAPISRGDILGEIIFTIDGKEVARTPLIATETITKKKNPGLFSKIFSIQ